MSLNPNQMAYVAIVSTLIFGSIFVGVSGVLQTSEGLGNFESAVEEDIIGDSYIDENGNTVEPGYIPRPTDQRVNFSLFFQDYIPGNLNYKMHLNMIYGSGLPFGPPKSEKYEDILRIPDYRRVDIGFSAILKSENKRSKVNFMNVFNSAWLSVEVFNLLDINNTISYLWVSDVGGRQYAVPNYLTRRQANLKLILRF